MIGVSSPALIFSDEKRTEATIPWEIAEIRLDVLPVQYFPLSFVDDDMASCSQAIAEHSMATVSISADKLADLPTVAKSIITTMADNWQARTGILTLRCTIDEETLLLGGLNFLLDLDEKSVTLDTLSTLPGLSGPDIKNSLAKAIQCGAPPSWRSPTLTTGVDMSETSGYHIRVMSKLNIGTLLMSGLLELLQAPFFANYQLKFDAIADARDFYARFFKSHMPAKSYEIPLSTEDSQEVVVSNLSHYAPHGYSALYYRVESASKTLVLQDMPLEPIFGHKRERPEDYESAAKRHRGSISFVQAHLMGISLAESSGARTPSIM